jgi:hypothetical protein
MKYCYNENIINKFNLGGYVIFTNEFDFYDSITTILDETDEHEDVRVIISDEYVFIQQWDDAREKYEVVCMTPKMFYELQEAMKKPEGLYYLELSLKV